MRHVRSEAWRRAWCAGIAIAYVCVVVSADDEAWIAKWDQFSLPSGYRGLVEVRSDGAHSHWIEFASHRDWAWRRSFRDLGDGRESLIDIQIGSRTETWSVDPVSSRATRSDRFSRIHQLSGELSATPMAIARVLVDGAEPIEIMTMADGTTTLRVDDGIGGRFRLEIDMVGDLIGGFRRLNSAGDVIECVVYEGWITLENGSSVPTRIAQVADVPPLKSAINMEYRVEEISHLDPSASAPVFEIPSGYFVFDRLEGVITESDGTVISELGPDPVPVGSERDGRAIPGRRSSLLVSTSLIVRVLIGGGVLLVVVAAWMMRRGRAA